eukprot:1672075-Alexandrium_andersonii.AAC.1
MCSAQCLIIVTAYSPSRAFVNRPVAPPEPNQCVRPIGRANRGRRPKSSAPWRCTTRTRSPCR